MDGLFMKRLSPFVVLLESVSIGVGGFVVSLATHQLRCRG